MSRASSLSFQAAAIRDVIPAARSDEIRSGLEAAIVTIEKVRAASGPIRTMLEVFKVFPDARIADIRETGDGE